MINRLKQLNLALPGLLLGIILYGCIIQVTGVWFVSDKLRYSTGLWIGIVLAIGLAVHIAMIIEQSVRNGGSNPKLMSVKSVMRYVVVVVVFTVMMKFHLGNLITAFLGVLGLKVSAYAQPFMHKMFIRFFHKDDFCYSEDDVEEEKEEVKL